MCGWLRLETVLASASNRARASILSERGGGGTVRPPYRAGGCAARGPGEAVAGVGPGAAEEEAADRGAVAGALEERPGEEELVEGQLAVERVAARPAVLGLQVLGGEGLPGEAGAGG